MSRSDRGSHASRQEWVRPSSEPFAITETRPEGGKMPVDYHNPHPSDLSGLEWAPPSSEPFATTETRPEDGKMLSDYGNAHLAAYNVSTPSAFSPINMGSMATTSAGDLSKTKVPTKSRRKYIYLAAALALVAICAAAIVGGILGSRALASKSDSSGQPPTSGAPSATSSSTATSSSSGSPTATPSPTVVAPNSRLSAVGWNIPTGFTRFLFYQDSNGTLRYSMAAGSGSVSDVEWYDSKTMTPQYTVENSTAIGSGILYHSTNGETDSQPHLEVFYINGSSTVNGFGWVSGHDFDKDSINEQNFAVMEGSDLSVLWPYIAFQNTEGALQLILYGPQGGRHFTSNWTWKTTQLRLKRKSGLVLVPTARNYSDITNYGRWAVVYQQEDGQLKLLEDPLGHGASGPYIYPGKSVKWNETFPSVTSSEILSFAAFSVGSSDQLSNPDVTIFVLYQDDTGTINQLRRDSADGADGEWRKTTPKVFEGADKGASITCVTTPIWEGSDGVGLRVLDNASSLNRCFFFKGGTVMETQLEGKDWGASKEVKMKMAE